MNLERDSVANIGFKKWEPPRWESDMIDINQLYWNVMPISSSHGTRSYQEGGAGCRVMAGYVFYLVWRI